MDKRRTIVIAAGGEGKRINGYFDKINFNKSKLFYPIKGKKIIRRVIDNTLIADVDEVFVLVKHHSVMMKQFLTYHYKSNSKVKMIVSPKRSTICEELLNIKSQLLDRSFVFMDGNVLFKPSLLDEIFNYNYSFGEALFNVAISPFDNAPTHLVFFINNNKIIALSNRITHGNLFDDMNYEACCSMGVIGMPEDVWPLIEYNSKCTDLDLLVEKVFNTSDKLVCPSRYTGQWLSVHTAEDLVDIDRKYKLIK